ncbi:MAG: preprotein translocase subunit YajC [Gemmatimonadota bacterium]
MQAFGTIALQGAGSPGLVMLINISAFVLILYFLLIRPQRKMAQRHKEMISSLQKGDEVVTEGGIIGTIVHLAEDRLTLKTGETRIVVVRGKVARKAGAADEER